MRWVTTWSGRRSGPPFPPIFILSPWTFRSSWPITIIKGMPNPAGLDAFLKSNNHEALAVSDKVFSSMVDRADGLRRSGLPLSAIPIPPNRPVYWSPSVVC
jgi:hypothetical protein